MTAISPVGTWSTPQFGPQAAATYKANLDACVNVAQRFARAFAPHPTVPAAMRIIVDSGYVFVGSVITQGVLTETAGQFSAFMTAPSASPRIDRVVVDYQTGAISVVTGLEAASPVPPAIPAGKQPICQIALSPGQTQITASNIGDERVPFVGSAASGEVSGTLARIGSTFPIYIRPMEVDFNLSYSGGYHYGPGSVGAFGGRIAMDSGNGDLVVEITQSAGDDGAAVTDLARIWKVSRLGTITLSGNVIATGAGYFEGFGNGGGIANLQGAYTSWNKSVGGGETDFVNHRGSGGVGGHAWYDTNDGSTLTLLATLDRSGNLATAGVITEAGALLTTKYVQRAKFFTSTAQTFSQNVALNVAHGLGIAPTKNVTALLKCVNAENGFSAGDVVPLALVPGLPPGNTLKADATNITVKVNSLTMTNPSTAGSSFNLTVANWQIILSAELAV